MAMTNRRRTPPNGIHPAPSSRRPRASASFFSSAAAAAVLLTFCLAAVTLHHAASKHGENSRAAHDTRAVRERGGPRVLGGKEAGAKPRSYWWTALGSDGKEAIRERPVETDDEPRGFGREAIQKMFRGEIPKQRFDEMESVGDKSDKYRRLRAEYDAKFPDDLQDNSDPETMAQSEAYRRRMDLLKTLKKREYKPMDFDNDKDCPLHPDKSIYPKAFRMEKILENWNPDDTRPRERIFQGICFFDAIKDREKIFNYRDAEVPFVVRNDPEVVRTVERWNDPAYLPRLLQKKERRTEYSENNHFMYWSVGGKKRRRGGVPKNWKPPTKMIQMTYPDFLSKANVTDDSKLGPDNPHWYYRLIGCGAMDRGCDHKTSSEALFDDLPFFQPKKSIYMVQPDQQRGIHCRFGMRGVIAENHFDGSRNFIVLLGGERRYILAHPEQCSKMYLLPKSHPSGRHSAVDWSDPEWQEFPEFAGARANEVVLQTGDALYLPTFWFHYIISLELNFQCNTRSGIEYGYKGKIDNCRMYQGEQK